MKNKLFHSIGISVSSSYIFFVLNFFGQLVLARILAPDDFGVFALVMSVSGVINLFVSLSVPMAYIKEKETDSLFESACYLSLIGGFLPVIISSVIYFPLSFYYNPLIAKYLFFVSLAKPFFSLSSIMIASVEKKAEFGKSYLLRGGALSSSLVISILLAYLGFKEVSLIAREIFSAVILFCIVKVTLKIPLSFGYNVKEVKILLSYSFKMIFSRGAEVAYFKIPFLLIGSVYGTATLGYFSQAFYLVSLVSTALNPITEKVAFVFYSQMGKNKDNFTVINLIILVIALPVSVVLFFYPVEIISFIYGDKWVDSAEYIKFLSVFGLLLPFFNNIKSFLYSVSLNHIVTLAYILSLIASLLFIKFDFVLYAYPVSITFALSIFIVAKFLYNKKNIAAK